MSAARILVVDDEPINLEIIADCLEDSGYWLTLAEGGEAAWNKLEEASPLFDLVVLDRMMPGVDGLALVERMKGDARFSATPVIMQTAAASPDQVREGLAAGVKYYLTKPFEPEALQTIVRVALEDVHGRVALEHRLRDLGNAFGLMARAEFKVRTLAEAHALAALLATLSPSPELAVMGLSELLVNGIEHGNLGIDFREKYLLKEEDRWLEEVERRLALPENASKRVRLTLTQDLEDWLFVIEDEGNGFEWEEFLELLPERAFAPNGRGIALARQLAFRDLVYEGCGNRVRASIPRRPREY